MKTVQLNDAGYTADGKWPIPKDANKYAIACLAIVKCAAEIGRAM